MADMFYNALSFFQELCWDITSTSKHNMFGGSPGNLAKYPECATLATVTPSILPSSIPTTEPGDTPGLNNDSISRETLADYLDGGSNYGPMAEWGTSQEMTNMTELSLSAGFVITLLLSSSILGVALFVHRWRWHRMELPVLTGMHSDLSMDASIV